MKEKTLRYPGHREKMKLFFDTGLFSKEPIDINGIKISPVDLISRLLFEKWYFSEADRDFTVLRVIITGVKENERFKYSFDLYDEFDEKSFVHSMARTTGYTASMGVRLLVEGKYKKRGVSPPEYVGMEKEPCRFILKGLKKRNIEFREELVKM